MPVTAVQSTLHLHETAMAEMASAAGESSAFVVAHISNNDEWVQAVDDTWHEVLPLLCTAHSFT